MPPSYPPSFKAPLNFWKWKKFQKNLYFSLFGTYCIMFPFLEPASKDVFQIYSIGKDLKNKEFNLEDVRSLIKK